MEKIKGSEKLTNEQIQHTGEKRTLLNNNLQRKVSWIGHLLRRNYLPS